MSAQSPRASTARSSTRLSGKPLPRVSGQRPSTKESIRSLGRPSTTSESSRPRSPTWLFGSQKLPEVSGQAIQPDIRASKSEGFSYPAYPAPPSVAFARPSWSRCSTKSSRHSWMPWGSCCARRGCLCDAPPPLSRTTPQIKKQSRDCDAVHARQIVNLETDDLFNDGELEASTVEPVPPQRQRRASLFLAAQLSDFKKANTAIGIVHTDTSDDEDGQRPRWAAAAKTPKSFRTHPKTSVSERIGRVDAQRRRKAMERRIEKQKDLNQKRFSALPEREREEIIEAFYKFDLDRSGQLDRHEVVQCLKEFGISGLTAEEARAIIEICSDATADDELQSHRVEDPDEDKLSQTTVAVELIDFALTVIPRVRRKLQELRSNSLLQHFSLFDQDQKGSITMDASKTLLEEMGISWGSFKDEYCQLEGVHDAHDEQDNEDGHHRPRQYSTTSVNSWVKSDGHHAVLPSTISFENFVSVVFTVRERSSREDRQRERQIQKDTKLPEALFQEFREDVLVLYELFVRFDIDESGFLDFEEVTFLIKDFGLLPSDPKERELVVEMIEACDPDGSGQFLFGEFLGLVREIRIHAMARNKEELMYMFDRYDRDHDDELSVAELSPLLVDLSLVPHTRREQEELGQLIHLVDSDGSGEVNFEEFQALCQKIREKMNRLRYEQEMEKARQNGFSTMEMHELRFVFDRLDTSHNGFIDKMEARIGVNLTKIPVGLEAFEMYFHMLDADGSGELDFAEFTELMRLLRDREGLFSQDKDLMRQTDLQDPSSPWSERASPKGKPS